MRCNYGKKDKQMQYCKNLMIAIHKEMSYEKLLENAVGFGEYYVPKLPEKVQRLILRVEFSNKMLTFFLDISHIKSLGFGDKIAIAPLTVDLLELYGVTPQKFADDYFADKSNLAVCIED